MPKKRFVEWGWSSEIDELDEHEVCPTTWIDAVEDVERGADPEDAEAYARQQAEKYGGFVYRREVTAWKAV